MPNSKDFFDFIRQAQVSSSATPPNTRPSILKSQPYLSDMISPYSLAYVPPSTPPEHQRRSPLSLSTSTKVRLPRTPYTSQSQTVKFNRPRVKTIFRSPSLSNILKSFRSTPVYSDPFVSVSDRKEGVKAGITKYKKDLEEDNDDFEEALEKRRNYMLNQRVKNWRFSLLPPPPPSHTCTDLSSFYSIDGDQSGDDEFVTPPGLFWKDNEEEERVSDIEEGNECHHDVQEDLSQEEGIDIDKVLGGTYKVWEEKFGSMRSINQVSPSTTFQSLQTIKTPSPILNPTPILVDGCQSPMTPLRSTFSEDSDLSARYTAAEVLKMDPNSVTIEEPWRTLKRSMTSILGLDKFGGLGRWNMGRRISA